MRIKILFLILSCICFSCTKYGEITRIVIADLESNAFEINDPDSILNLRRIMDNRSSTKRVPLRDKGRIDIYFYDSSGNYVMWLFCNTIQDGPLLVKENSYSTIYKNAGLDSFFKEFRKQNPTFNYW